MKKVQLSFVQHGGIQYDVRDVDTSASLGRIKIELQPKTTYLFAPIDSEEVVSGEQISTILKSALGEDVEVVFVGVGR